ncbi:MAG: hypothetical protein HQ522_01595 [Bacteroidetes bacterium]|nr:hypothetical protein [Bacteroidota bacterium]
MTEFKEQKIIVLLSLNSTDNTLILNGIKIASIFRKELCLLYNYSKNEKKKREKFKAQLIEYTSPLKNELPGLLISTLLLSENRTDLPEKLADEFEAIMIVAPASKFSIHSKSLSESAIPFLFVNENRVSVPDYKNLILPLDLRKESSESALWGSYFGRFNNSKIVVVVANDKGKEEKQLITKNAVLTKKIFMKFNIDHKIFKGTKSSLRNTFEALDLALSSKSDLLVILGSSTITPLDLLIGLPERKVIKKSADLPVLVINPRRDNYMLCD